jgi:hypothetical protein
MKQLIVASLPALATTVQDLAPGEGGFLTDIENPNAVAIDLDGVDKDAKIQVVHKTKKGKVQVSPVFTLNQIAEALYKVYNAGTKQKWTITPVIPAVQERGMEWTVKLVDTTGGNLSVDQKSFNVVHSGVDFTAASLVAAFKEKINNSTFKAVATGTDTLIVEAETPDNHFSVAVDNEMENAGVVLTTKAMPSSGASHSQKVLLTRLCILLLFLTAKSQTEITTLTSLPLCFLTMLRMAMRQGNTTGRCFTLHQLLQTIHWVKSCSIRFN